MTLERVATICLALAVLAGALGAAGAELRGELFVDSDGDGIRDPGEPGVPGGVVEVFGRRDAGGSIDVSHVTGDDGSFLVPAAELAAGCFAVRVAPPSGYRSLPQRTDCGAGLGHPVGMRRYASPPHLIDRLRSGGLVHVALGDSIAEPASLCTISFPAFDRTDYIGWFGDRLACIAPAAVTSNQAIGGKTSRSLLEPAGTCGPPNMPRPGGDRCDNIFDTIALGPDLITISIGGNDWLGEQPADPSAPTPMEVAASIDALISTRSNIQELLGTLGTRLPDTDVIFNSVYNNTSGACAAPSFHNVWVPIWNQALRDGVWGHGDRFQVAEIFPEYAHQDVNGASCCGERSLICGDGIHPTVSGAEVHLEKVWEAAGGVNLGSRDPLGTTTNADLSYPVLELAATRWPSRVIDATTGATSPDAALALDDAGALIPAGDGSFVVSGFDARPDGIAPQRIVVGVRYRTTGSVPSPAGEIDATYFEASVDGSFAPPIYTVTGWNTLLPIVGAGASAPAPNAMPDVPVWREVRALVTKNLEEDGTATGAYSFPRLSWDDVATLAVRFRGVTRGAGADASGIEWDAAWLEVYGERDGVSAPDVYRSESPIDLVSPANLVGSAGSPPWDEVAPAAPALYYAIDDGAGYPPLIRLVKRAAPAALSISWD